MNENARIESNIIIFKKLQYSYRTILRILSVLFGLMLFDKRLIFVAPHQSELTYV